MTGGRIRVADLLRTPGATDREQGTVTLDPRESTGARLDGNASYRITLEAEGGRVHVTGDVRAGWSGACRRCLETTTGELQVRVGEIFEPYPVEGETWPIDDGEIDLTPALTQALLLELPLAPLCDTACAGPDPDRYPTIREPEPDKAPASGRDPRWAALDGLRLGGRTRAAPGES